MFRSASSLPSALRPSSDEYVDHFLRRLMPFVYSVNHAPHPCHRSVLVRPDDLLIPSHLVRAAMFFHAQRSRRPLRLPRYMQLQFPPLQLQRFLRSCVLATAHALVKPPASVFRLVDARTKSRWIERIFVRVMSGFVAKAEVRRQGAHLSFASAGMVWPSFLFMHSAAYTCGYLGTMPWPAMLRLRPRC
jgi:hypothetical protein